MMYKVPVKLLASVFSLLFVLPLLTKFSGGLVEVSALETYTKMSADTWRSLYGDSFPCTYTINNVSYSGSFVYEHTFTSKSANGVNVASNTVCNNASDFAQYDIVCYSLTLAQSSVTVYNIDIDLDMIVSGGARGGFMMGQVPSTTASNITTVINTISNVPDNYFGEFGAVTANTSADSSLANYWGIVGYANLSNAVRYFRFIPYDDVDFTASGLHFEGFTSAQGSNKLLLYVLAPYYYGVVSPEITETTVSTSNIPSSDINVTVYVDNSIIESQLNEYLGADDTRITTYETINLGTFPTFDYNNATETVNISQVVSETGDGINSIWYLISGLFSSVPVLVWLVPFCIFMSIMSFVLWRKGG